MLEDLIRGTVTRFGHKDRPSSGYNFKEHKEFVSHVGSEGGHFSRQTRYDNNMRLPANHGRPPMPVCDEEDENSDGEDFFKSSRNQHSNNHRLSHQQPSHLNFMPPHGVAPPPHNGKISNVWHEDASHGGHGKQHGMQNHGMQHGMQNHGMQHHGSHEMQHHGEHGMQHHGGHGMQHHGEHKMQQHGGHGMQQHGGHGMQQHGGHGMQQHGGHGMQHGGHGMQHHGGFEMQHHSGHGMQNHGGHGMQHHGGFMASEVPPHHMKMKPSHVSGGGGAVVVRTTEKWHVNNNSGGHHKVGWGSKGL